MANDVYEYFSSLSEASNLFGSRRIDRDLVANFFMTFSRAEYALKRAGFFSRDKGGGVDIQWDKFADSIAHSLTGTKDTRLTRAINYLTEHPPRKQFVNAVGHLDWKERKKGNQSDAVFVVRSITTVRNNLFHGGKEVAWTMAERDHDLIENSLIVLAHCLNQNHEVRIAFAELPAEAPTA
jgi:hypothetical protein